MTLILTFRILVNIIRTAAGVKQNVRPFQNLLSIIACFCLSE